MGALLLAACAAFAEVRLPAVFGHHMVLQQNESAPVWGWAEPGERVTVTFRGSRASATADAGGRWRVELGTPEADGEASDLVVEGTNRVVCANVLVGEVWLCSGQSNMKAGVGSVTDAAKVIAAASFPSLRLFQVRMWAAAQPQADLAGEWKVCSPETVGGFSAVGFFFGRSLHEALHVPVGIIDSTSGGTAAEAWVRRGTLEADPVLQGLVKDDPGFFETMAQYERESAAWEQAKAEGRKDLPPFPKSPFRGWGYPVSSFYNAMIAPLAPFGVKGFAWYQGEARTGRPFQYEHELDVLIADWRGVWGRGDLPFLIVQLPNINPVWNWAVTREAQLRVARRTPRVGLVVTIDVGDANDLHPRNKEPIGRRLALAAQGMAYGMDVVSSGPVFERAEIDGARMRLHFSQLGGGLASGGGALKGFVVAGEDRRFVPGHAVIEGDTVVVSSPDVKAPVAVRYAFEDNPDCNLCNRAGLPASPFRTDDWPVALSR